VKARMLQYQKQDVDVLIVEFDKRLPQHDAQSTTSHESSVSIYVRSSRV
jgi:hypothetical protein